MKKTGKLKYLFTNMAIFTIGSFVSKLLVFFLVPFYTSILTESEYGIADVMQSSLLLLVPLLSINAGEAALRYGLEYTDDRDIIFLYGIKRVSFSIIPVIILSGALSLLFPDYRIYFLFFIVLYTADAFFEYMHLFCDSIESFLPVGITDGNIRISFLTDDRIQPFCCADVCSDRRKREDQKCSRKEFF